MKGTSKSSSRIKRPVIVSIPARGNKERFTLKEAEEILERHGASPATPEEIEEAKKFDRPDY